MSTAGRTVEDLFRVEHITAGSLLLVGYKLFPCISLEMHPRLTILSGNNAVGKTTLLDAIQSIFLCHQKYINLNVASGQNDRNLAGQLADRTGWAVITVVGHERVTGIGVRLQRKPASDQVDLSPFTLLNIPISSELFLDPETRIITPDFKTLKRKVLVRDLDGDVQDFSRLEEYHGFLHAQGLFPVALMQAGKKRLFSGLWRQITQPKLDALKDFLREMLCVPPANKINFGQVEQLMRERKRVELRLGQLERFRSTRTELLERARTYAAARLEHAALAVEYPRQQRASIQAKLRDNGARQKSLSREKKTLDQELAKLDRDQETSRSELRKIYGQRSALHKQLEHQREYGRCLKGMEVFAGKIGTLEPVLATERIRADEIEIANQTLDKELTGERETRIRLEEQEKERHKEAREWQSFAERLGRAEKEFGLSLGSRAEVDHARTEVEKEKAELEQLPKLRKQRESLAERVAAHEKAVKIWLHVCRLRDIESCSSPQKEVRDTMYEQAIREKKDLEERLRNLEAELAPLCRERDLLSQGRPPLPPQAVELVDKGVARPLADRFEDLDYESAASWQRRLGPLAQALEPLGQLSGEDMQGGAETLWFMTLPDDVLSEQAGDNASLSWHEPETFEHGSLGGWGDIAWYQPDEPVWLSARARFARLERLERQITDGIARKQSFEKRIGELDTLTSMLFKLSEAWEALLDRDANKELVRLETIIHRLEAARGQILKKHDALVSLDRDAHLFTYREAPQELKRIREGLAKATNRIDDIEKRCRAVQEAWKHCRKQIKEWETALSRWRSKSEAFLVRKQGLEKEEPLDVLLGKVDLSKGEELEQLVRDLEDKDRRLRTRKTTLSERKGALGNELKGLVASHARLAGEEQRWSEIEAAARNEWHMLYPDTEPVSRMEPVLDTEVTDAQVRRRREHGVIMDRISGIVAEHGLAMDLDKEPDVLVDLLLESLLPPGIDLDQEEEQLNLLSKELTTIEAKIRGYVEEIRKNVDHELNALSRRIDKVNRILSDLSFGRIRRVRLERTMLPAYEGLKRLRGGQLTLFAAGKPLSLQEFLDQIRDFITRHSRVADIDEDKIADYRTYVHITWSITDEDGAVRRHGFSSGEGLGINLAICLSLLFYLGDATAKDRGEGMLVMALDEAERLDEQALATVRSLLDRVKCQLVLALPRTLQVKSSICHMLTPLEEGVTHVSVYHKG